MKCFAGIGEIGDDGNCVGGNEVEEDDVVTLIPFVASRDTCFDEETDNPAFCNEAIRPAIDLAPDELDQR